MTLRSPEELVEMVSKELQQIEERLDTDDRRLSIIVPSGVVRPVSKIRPDYEFVSDETLKRNITYAVEALDFYKWVINRFRLYGPVASYLYKTGVILVNMIIEALVYDFLGRKLPKGEQRAEKYRKNINKLEDKCGVPKHLCERMRKLHERRANIHLQVVSDLESDKYTLKDWNMAMKPLKNSLL
jgi:hypothetical protein